MTRQQCALTIGAGLLTATGAAWATMQLLFHFGWRGLPIILFILALNAGTLVVILRRLPSAK
jgi:hypothetical protein